jgi:hypothetical protein
MVGAGFRRNGWVVGVKKTVSLSGECAVVVGSNVFDFKAWFEELEEFLKGAGVLRRSN